MENAIFNPKKLNSALQDFAKYRESPKFKEDTLERDERKLKFNNLYRRDFDELTIAEIIKKLWASLIWGNKDFLVNQIISSNGLDKVSKELKNLIFGKGTPGERYERFLNEIKYMGPSTITEILCYADPKHAGIWNEKARKALTWLEAKDIPLTKYKINAVEYDKFNSILLELSSLLKNEGYKDVDLLFVDYFLWEIWNNSFNNLGVDVPKKESLTKNLSRHDEIKEKIAQIGSWLGFEIEMEKHVAQGAKVDAVWVAKIANLGSVSYVFEVQDRGSIDGLILNLQKAQRNPTVQKLIIVSDEAQLVKIQSEAKAMPESFRKAAVFWDALDVDKTYQSLQQVSASIAKLNLIEEFE